MTKPESPKVAVIMGSQSDWPTMKHACDVLDELGIGHKPLIVSAHRTPDRLVSFAKNARSEGFQVIIAGAGGAAHLPGMTAAFTPLPVFGVPVESKALSGQDSAIVTDIPGTTRDVLREQIDLDGIPVHLADTAGIRETTDRIEAEGVRRARQALESADIVLLVEDASLSDRETGDPEIELPDNVSCIRVNNKLDLVEGAQSVPLKAESTWPMVWISAKTGQGMDTLRHRIKEAVGASDHAEGSFSARQRHIDALKRTARHLEQGRGAMERNMAGELLAEELRMAQQALGEITGEFLPDDLLGEIFSSFCIGK